MLSNEAADRKTFVIVSFEQMMIGNDRITDATGEVNRGGKGGLTSAEGVVTWDSADGEGNPSECPSESNSKSRDVNSGNVLMEGKSDWTNSEEHWGQSSSSIYSVEPPALH